MSFGLSARTGPGNHDLDGVQIPPWEGTILRERGAHCKIWGLSAVSCAKTAEPIDLMFGLRTQVGRRKQKFNMGGHIGATWRIRSVCGGDVVSYFDHLLVIIRPQRSTTYVDVAYCYRRSSASVCRSACHDREPCKNGWTDRDAVLVLDSGGPKEPCRPIRLGPYPPREGAILRGKRRFIVRYRECTYSCAAAMRPFLKLLWPLVLSYYFTVLFHVLGLLLIYLFYYIINFSYIILAFYL